MRTAALQKCSVYSGSLILVNARHPYRGVPDPALLMPVNGESGVLMDRRAAVLLERLMAEIRGWNGIVPVSGWRPREEQQAIWDDTLRESGEAFTKKYVAFPGCSEHETGLAIDLGLRQEQIDFIRPDFPDVGVCRIFRRRAAAYGFVLRYPADKEPVTGIACEPLHFRYVGVPHAEIMDKLGLTLEEYLDYLKEYPYGMRPLVHEKNNLVFELSFLSDERADDLKTENLHGMVSGDNSEGFIVTEWKDRDV